ncbi:acyl-coenzyme A thioesterase PaaI-like protein [Nocardioides aromaticivorans]|uniref:Acyl-coenzyme A thioesterase PaaI-like protein n=1 Tax=Nocardioides aromaticivorans TaxID=200618 RepID=A0A7Y9ZKT4_9ACTN|nr:acyl-CoA thioesterase domain-containing protein [Nocardioides aromaticivorans]NYI47269.1 acyl-coenzyme A thioesterase PaaI-like protein [Nocardioides aromaticivorans]
MNENTFYEPGTSASPPQAGQQAAGDGSRRAAVQFAWFRDEGDALVPLPLAQSLWRSDQMHGVAVSGLLARALEKAVDDAGRSELVPARYHVDLFRPARMIPTTARATVVREGPRLLLADAVVEQEGEVVARASGTFLQPSSSPDGAVWTSPEERPSPPPLELAPLDVEHHVPIFASDAPWSDNFGDHQNGGRHQTWHIAVPIVEGEECTPFQAVASVADATSMVTNWGAGGVEYINTDIDLALSRRPTGISIGLRATDHVAHAGIAAGTAEVFDREGSLGTATVTSLANTRRTVDLSGGVSLEGSA